MHNKQVNFSIDNILCLNFHTFEIIIKMIGFRLTAVVAHLRKSKLNQ